MPQRRDARTRLRGPSPLPRRSVARRRRGRWGSVHRRPSPPPPGRAVPPFLPGASRFSRRHAIYYEWSTTFSQRYDGNTTCARDRTLRHVTRGTYRRKITPARPKKKGEQEEWPPTRRVNERRQTPTGEDEGVFSALGTSFLFSPGDCLALPG